ncbi:hypothetical protein NX059_011100 [Plenodomus lindquistii]|nr:hypothetical protein NX059_011100 [Plenodomus lindquistii]
MDLDMTYPAESITDIADNLLKIFKQGIFVGAHTSVHDAFWTVRALLNGVELWPFNDNDDDDDDDELDTSEPAPRVFPQPWRLVSIDFEGGPGSLPREVGLTILSSKDVENVPICRWGEFFDCHYWMTKGLKGYINDYRVPNTPSKFSATRVLHGGKIREVLL